MNYYILPKNNVKLKIFFEVVEPNDDTIYISHTLNSSLLITNNHIKKYSTTEVDDISKKINPYEFIFSNVTDGSLSISKLKPESNIYYELREIICTFNILDYFEKLNNGCDFIHVGENNESINLLLNTVSNNGDTKFSCDFNHFSDIDKFKTLNNTDFSIFECGNNDRGFQINKLIFVLYIICLKMNENGSLIIKLDELTQKATIDIIFIMNNLFEKVYLMKPLLSNILKNENYVICKNFIGPQASIYVPVLEQCVLKIIRGEMQNTKIISILKNNLSVIFLTKIEEYNAIFGQQLLESKDQLISIINNKNKFDKIDALKRTNIQKGIAWCEKYDIPHNKFSEKINIFLNVET